MYIFFSPNFDEHWNQQTIKSRPDYTTPITPYPLINQTCYNNGNNSKNSCVDKKEGNVKKPFIGLIQKIKDGTKNFHG
jgi:hypothetical protein